MEQQQVEVPYLNVEIPGSGNKEELAASVEAEVNNDYASLDIPGVNTSRKTLCVISALRSTGPYTEGERMRISDQLILNAPGDIDIKTLYCR